MAVRAVAFLAARSILRGNNASWLSHHLYIERSIVKETSAGHRDAVKTTKIQMMLKINMIGTHSYPIS
jgi:hypothetical protein